MAFLTNYDHDIFVSYAHVDDEPLPGAADGWVTTLIRGLRTQLDQKLGRSEAHSMWMDGQLARNVQLTPQIFEILQKTACLVVILSPGYVASAWCRREKDAFLDFVGNRVRSSSRVFVVERDEVKNDQRPAELDELVGYRFWVADREGGAPRILGSPRPNPEDLRYYERLNDLSHDLARTLQSLKQAEEGGKKPTEARDSRPPVFLAEVTDDLDAQRDEVKRYLDQAELRVLPDCWYPRDPTAFQHAMEKDLARCELFVQLISRIAGKKSPDLPYGYVGLQYDCARRAGKTLLQWCSTELDPATVDDPKHRALLERDTVYAMGLEEFKREVKERALFEPPAPRMAGLNAFVFVDIEPGDRSLADDVCKVLDRYGVGYSLPLQRGKPSEIREDLEHNLLECDALVVVYGRSTAAWVRSQLLQCRKSFSKRDSPLQSLSVYQGPPGPKEPLDLRLPNMQIIDCVSGFKEAKLKSFIEGLQTGGDR